MLVAKGDIGELCTFLLDIILTIILLLKKPLHLGKHKTLKKEIKKHVYPTFLDSQRTEFDSLGLVGLFFFFLKFKLIIDFLKNKICFLLFFL